MEEKITLDRKAFKTLASGTRVDILKSLGRRRKMLAELSKELGMSASTVKEHMDKLSSAGLVVQIDEGRKWKYYELTRKGKGIVYPGETRVWVLLAISALAIISIGYDMLQKASPAMTFTRPLLTAESAAPAVAPKAVSAAPALPYFHIAGMLVFSILLGLGIGYFVTRKRVV